MTAWLLFVVVAAVLAVTVHLRARNRSTENWHRDSLDALARLHRQRRVHRG